MTVAAVDIAAFKRALAAYANVDAASARANLAYFVQKARRTAFFLILFLIL